MELRIKTWITIKDLTAERKQSAPAPPASAKVVGSTQGSVLPEMAAEAKAAADAPHTQAGRALTL